MADEWKAGDLALCVESFDQPGPISGGIYRVLCIRYNPDPDDGDMYFKLDGQPINENFWACKFRRIPPHTPDAEDRKTIRLLNGAPVTEDA